MRKSVSAGAIALSLTALWGASAQAQQAGTYEGTTADGNSIGITVGTNPDTGNLAVLGLSVGFSAPCKGKGTGLSLDTGWGLGLQQDIVNDAADILIDGQYLNIQAHLTFTDDSNITGTIDTRSPMLIPKDPRPKKAAFCESATQALSMSFVGAARARPLRPGEIVLHQGRR